MTARPLVLAAALALAVAACGADRARTAAPARGATVERADALFRSGDYAAAASVYEQHLVERPDDPRNEAVLVRLALLDLVYGVPRRDSARGEERLREVVRRYPDGELREVAQYLLELRRELAAARAEASARGAEAERGRARAARLEAQIEELKRIDLERP